MHITFITAVWQRPEICKLFNYRFKELKKDFDVSLVVAGSEKHSKNYIPSQDIYVQVPNKPLIDKWNAATKAASTLNPDYLMLLGSDDLIGNSLIYKYHEPMSKGIDYIYLLDFYFYDVVSKKALYWGGYNADRNRGHALGAGRCFSKSLMNKVGWAPWAENYNYDHLLDQALDQKLQGIDYTKQGFKIGNAFGIDIKSPVNMTPFAPWAGSITEPRDAKELLSSHLSEEEVKLIMA